MIALPEDHPCLWHLAEAHAREAHEALRAASLARHDGVLARLAFVPWDEAKPRVREAWVASHAERLRDLSRPASRDLWVRHVAEHTTFAPTIEAAVAARDDAWALRALLLAFSETP